MLQAILPIIKISSEKKEGLDSKLRELFLNVKTHFKDVSTFQELLCAPNFSLYSKYLKDEQTPESFTRQHLIDPLIEFLGYEMTPETHLYAPSGRKAPDYVIRPNGKSEPLFYVEAESLNKDLKAKGEGIAQVRSWLISRASKTDYGIATDGLLWFLLKFDSASAQTKIMLRVDLRPIFIKLQNSVASVSANEINEIEKNFLMLDVDYVSKFLREYLETIEIQKEEISQKFYNDYVKNVFGYDKNGKPVQGACLLNKIDTPFDTSTHDKNLFAVVFMNRIIFTKFLEEKGIVSKDLLKKLLIKYKSLSLPSTFYKTYLHPLFYEVFNKGMDNRRLEIRNNELFKEIPYLNGGLFNQIVRKESDYDIENDGIELVINNLLDEYDFGSDSVIDPDILGYIFEKTINFISGTGTNQQRMKGAYYTPDDVVEFIIEETLAPIIFQKMLQGLRDSGWTEIDIKGFDSLEDILNPENCPQNKKYIKKMLNRVDEIKILDPACGSGHFLTAMLSLLLRVKEDLLISSDVEINRYQIKKDIISKNIFGVDIDENAIEIARLRLWLSLIDEVEIEDEAQIDTLPNIDFNIIVGNSLIGWLDEPLDVHPLVSLLESEYVKATLDNLEVFYGNEITIARELLHQLNVSKTIEAYKILVSIYSRESGEKAVRIKGILEQVREKLYQLITNSYLNFVNENIKLRKEQFRFLGQNLQKRLPFHWKVDFEEVINSGGFDVIVGNPPYIENRMYSKIDLTIIKTNQKQKGYKFYFSKDCGNTHAYFIERSIKLLKDKGKFGFIIPIALVSTKRMGPIREFIQSNSNEVKYFNFDDRPGKIFSGIEDCRSTIIITEKGKGTNEVTTSKYHRWQSKNRSHLFDNLVTTGLVLENLNCIVPKIGTELEENILSKLSEKAQGKTIDSSLDEEGNTIWYYNAPRYWMHVHSEDFLPVSEVYSEFIINKEKKIVLQKLKEQKVSTHYKPLIVQKNQSLVINGLLNTSLFYWWFVIQSNGRDLNSQHIRDFPFNEENITDQFRNEINQLVTDLMKSYVDNSNEKINVRSGGYAIKITEIIPKKSKHILDEIDDLFSQFFGFSDKEREFIKSFDLGFRMGN